MSIVLPKGFGVGAFGSYYSKALSVQGYTDPHYSLDALFIMKRFFKQNLNLYLALRGLVNSKVTTFTYDGNNEEYRIFKQDTFGLAFRITYLFNIGKKYDMEQVSSYFETDKK